MKAVYADGEALQRSIFSPTIDFYQLRFVSVRAKYSAGASIHEELKVRAASSHIVEARRSVRCRTQFSASVL